MPKRKPMHPDAVGTHTLPTGELAVFCWCMRRIVYVEPSVIANGKTEGCGAEGCEG